MGLVGLRIQLLRIRWLINSGVTLCSRFTALPSERQPSSVRSWNADVVQTKFVVPDVAQVKIPALPMLPDLGVDHLP